MSALLLLPLTPLLRMSADVMVALMIKYNDKRCIPINVDEFFAAIRNPQHPYIAIIHTSAKIILVDDDEDVTFGSGRVPMRPSGAP